MVCVEVGLAQTTLLLNYEANEKERRYPVMMCRGCPEKAWSVMNRKVWPHKLQLFCASTVLVSHLASQHLSVRPYGTEISSSEKCHYVEGTQLSDLVEEARRLQRSY